MTHIKDKNNDELTTIILRLKKNKIPYCISKSEGKITMVDTKDKELIKFAKKNNKELQ